MSTPQHEPPKPKVSLTKPDGAIERPVAPKSPPKISPLRTDPSFYRNLLLKLNPMRATIRAVMAGSKFGIVALAVDVAATANMGDPFLFSGRRDRWKELSGLLEVTRKNVWTSYFGPVVDHWEGDAVAILQQYLRFKINNLYTELGKISNEMSSTMQGQFKEVAEYDLSVFSVYAAAEARLRVLGPASRHPVGEAALALEIVAFAGLLGNLGKQWVDIYMSYAADLNKLELKLNTLKAAFYPSDSPANESRVAVLQLNKDIENPDNWIAK